MLSDIQPDTVHRNGALDQIEKTLEQLLARALQLIPEERQKFMVATDRIPAS